MGVAGITLPYLFLGPMDVAGITLPYLFLGPIATKLDKFPLKLDIFPLKLDKFPLNQAVLLSSGGILAVVALSTVRVVLGK